MKASRCQCGNKVFFENTQCQRCASELGFLVDEGDLSAIRPATEGGWIASLNQRVYRKCQNYITYSNCNWMVSEYDSSDYCLSCRMSEIIPDLSKPENFERWNRIEQAKRRLLYNFIWLRLPLSDKQTDPANGLAFRLMEDNLHYSEFIADPADESHVITGHLNNTITLNIEEADTVLREEIRTRMQERYRTLLGHMRHESGHFFWDKLIKDTPFHREFRSVFGDEQIDYKTALTKHYNEGPAENWQTSWVSAYASSHPWEDWAECWAHYLHIIDTLETAYDFGGEAYTSNYVINDQRFDKEYLATINIIQIMEEWSQLSTMLNEMNRSLGLADAYPFYSTNLLVEKMAFIHKIVTS